MKAVTLYDVAPAAVPKLMEHFPAHRARLDEFHKRGVLIAARPLGNPPESANGHFHFARDGRRVHQRRSVRHERPRCEVARARLERRLLMMGKRPPASGAWMRRKGESVHDQLGAEHWCETGHIGYVLKGALSISFDGKVIRSKHAMGSSFPRPRRPSIAPSRLRLARSS
jgi:hypothetical protein